MLNFTVFEALASPILFGQLYGLHIDEREISPELGKNIVKILGTKLFELSALEVWAYSWKNGHFSEI